MSQVRKQTFSTNNIFGEVVDHVIQKSLSVYHFDEIQFVSDSYINRSVKECERIRRKSSSGKCHLARISDTTPNLQQLDQFWFSTLKMNNFKLFTHQQIFNYSPSINNPIIASGYDKHRRFTVCYYIVWRRKSRCT